MAISLALPIDGGDLATALLLVATATYLERNAIRAALPVITPAGAPKAGVVLALVLIGVTLNTRSIGRPVTWRNPRAGNRGTVTTTNQLVIDEGYCREYQQVVTIDGREQKAYGTACQQPDGSWKIGA